MKKNILILACLATVLVSCQKDELSLNPESQNADAAKVSTSNNEAGRISYTKRILVEEFVGLTYGDAPEFVSVLNTAINTNPGRIIKALHHNNDILESPQTDVLVANLSANGYMAYPTSLIDRTSVNGFRFVSSGNSQSAMNQQLGKPATCGISITSAINKNKVDVEVTESFNTSLTSSCNITVYMIEDKVVLNGMNNLQANNFNNNSKSKFYKKGNPIKEYTHENVVRACLTPAMGVQIKPGAISPGGTDRQTFTFEIPGDINQNNCYFIAFVSRCINGVAADVENVQIAKLGTTVTMN